MVSCRRHRCGAGASPAQAQRRPDPGEIRGLKLGLKAQAMTLDGFGDLACGSNGGPPRQKIEDWSEFRKCRAEDNGLHEVYARFDDEDEYIGKAIDEPRYARGKTGTRVAGHPVILSVLFDRDGVLRVLRFVSDPRGAPTSGAWRTCCGSRSSTATSRTDGPARIFRRPRARRRSAACSSSSAARKRRPGAPRGRDALPAQARPERQRPRHRRIPRGPFESSTRFEIFDPATRNRSLIGPPERSLIRHLR